MAGSRRGKVSTSRKSTGAVSSLSSVLSFSTEDDFYARSDATEGNQGSEKEDALLGVPPSAGANVKISGSSRTNIGWAELLVALSCCVITAYVSLAVAMAVEVAISIHYFEIPMVPRFDFLEQRERDLNLHHRVTIVDPDLAAVRFQNPGSTKLERVIQRISSSGHPRTLLLVDEVPRIGKEGDNPYSNLTASASMAVPPKVDYAERASVRPSLCSDHYSVGYDSWDTLKLAIQEANSISVERFVRWSRFFAEADGFAGTFQDDALYYEEDIILPICPGARWKASRGPIFINAPNLIITCEGCEILLSGGSHFSFGAHAKHVVVRGVTFRGATTSSLLFFKHGAFVSFEDCAWYENAAVTGRFGAVADVNSTSVVHFHRCHIGNSQKGEAPGLASSLSVRT